jgi:hypothetical protein
MTEAEVRNLIASDPAKAVRIILAAERVLRAIPKSLERQINVADAMGVRGMAALKALEESLTETPVDLSPNCG